MKTPKSAQGNSAMGTATIPPKMRDIRPTTISPAKSYGPRQTGDSVLFTAFYPKANVIQIAGDFNNWQPEKNTMTKAGDGTWQARITLAKGTYHYRFVVDGKWLHDTNNDLTESNPYGELNSVVKVI